ncbi:hypothetical protein [Algoriphagus pacificus]|uniref:GH16 domain-containing protein n=1 Tax=Algoriphagus pacificus TaxID=2811234 RepID=A0ABS3CL97_9BACT|nr:hypothetical protein [Algoriphagus pacificus]MBN7817319.1 hypothetical protein [Algoriphagus pacificus]
MALLPFLYFMLASALASIFQNEQNHNESLPLAVKYPFDQGIEDDPNVIFSENFEGDLNSIFAKYTDILNYEGMHLDSLDVPATRSKALVMTNSGSENHGGHLFKKFEKGFEGTVFIRYYVKYPKSSQGYIHHESVWVGGSSPALPYPKPSAGTCDLGGERFSVSYEPIQDRRMDSYIYWGGMKAGAQGKCYGNDLINGSPKAKELVWDEWMCVELMIKLNDPVNSKNGELKIWQDGVEVGHWGPGFPNGHWDKDSWFNDPEGEAFEGFQWRNNPSLNLNYLWFEFFDDTTPKGESHHIKFANLVMARSYIGPISTN